MSMNSPSQGLLCVQMDPTTNPQFKTEPLVTIEIPGRLPSWNEVLGMEHWARDKYKISLREKFLCALRASVQDCSTRTISVRNILSTAADTLAYYDRTARERRKLRSASKRLARKSQSLFESKSSKQPENVPF